MTTAKLPRGSLRLAAEAIEDADPDGAWPAAEVALTAGLDVIQRDARRQMARHLLALTEHADIYNTYYAWRSALGKAARGQPLPDVPGEDSTDGSRT